MADSPLTSAPPAPSAPPTAAGTAATGTAATGDSATRIFSQSVVISGIRCLLAYIVFPWILPFLGIARDAAPAIGIVISLVAIGFNVASIRRFWKADHRWKYWITAINVTVICFLVVLLAIDIAAL